MCDSERRRPDQVNLSLRCPSALADDPRRQRQFPLAPRVRKPGTAGWRPSPGLAWRRIPGVRYQAPGANLRMLDPMDREKENSHAPHRTDVAAGRGLLPIAGAV